MKNKYLLYFAILCFALSSCAKEDDSVMESALVSDITKSFDTYDFLSNEADFTLFLDSLLEDWYLRNVSGCVSFRYLEGMFHYICAEGEVDLVEDEPLMMLTKKTSYQFWQKEQALNFALQQAKEENKTVSIRYYKFNHTWVVTVTEELPDEPAPNGD